METFIAIFPSIVKLIGIVSLLIVFIFIIRPMINRFLEIKDREQKIKKFSVYNSINAETINTVLNDYIDGYINRYIVFKFVSQKISYIRREDTEAMIKDITKNILIEISDLYLYYISLIYGYENDRELASFILNKVSNATIDTVSNFNSSNGFNE